jgi:hypothetical protein
VRETIGIFFCPPYMDRIVKLCCVGFENVLSCSILEFLGSFDWLCLTDVINFYLNMFASL